METGRPAWIEVDLAAIRTNVHRIRDLIGPRCGMLAVVKANAYGHGLVAVARAALEAGASFLGVAIVAEGIALREAGISAPILMFGSALPHEAADLVAHDIIAGVDTLAEAQALSHAAHCQRRIARAHLKVDSGMGRRGVPAAEAAQLMSQMRALPGLSIEGVFTHFATADEPDLSFARQQAAAFQACLDQMRAEGTLPDMIHAANSAATLTLPEARHRMVRPGLLLYGVPPFPGSEAQLALQPAMSLKARVVSVKELPAAAGVGYGRAYVMPRAGRIAILPLGYADGFSRQNSNNGDVLLRGRRAPIRGRICMDQFMVDVTDLPDVRVGEEAVLLGRQGDEEITLDEIANRTGTITHETMAALTPRLPRHYIG